LATGKPRLDSTYTATLEKDSELVFRSFDRFTGHTTAFWNGVLNYFVGKREGWSVLEQTINRCTFYTILSHFMLALYNRRHPVGQNNPSWAGNPLTKSVACRTKDINSFNEPNPA
jgi:hypothetical protein